MIVYGPVPSRRLGRSIGINNIPAKICSYSCVYCQLGRTNKLRIKRESFHSSEDIFEATKKRVEDAKSENEDIDFLTFVPDGEPTLDSNLHDHIKFLQQLDLPIAVITNSSLIWQSDVKDALLDADLVSLKIDAVTEKLWRRVDRPHGLLELDKIMDGIHEFSKQFKGKLLTETMFLHDIDYSTEIDQIADFLSGLRIDAAYVAVPTRPPAEDWVLPAHEDILNRAVQSFSKVLGAEKVELLVGYEGDVFSSTGNLEEDLLSITAVHPMREDAVRVLVEKLDENWASVELLVAENKLIQLTYEGEIYYMRKISSRA